MDSEKMVLVLCDLTISKSVKPIISLIKRFVNKDNADMLVVYVGDEVMAGQVADGLKGFEVPLSIVDTYEWGQDPAFVLVITDTEKSVVESVARHHFIGKTYAVITMMMARA